MRASIINSGATGNCPKEPASWCGNGRPVARSESGFDFAIVEECDRFDECEAFLAVDGGRMYGIEYDKRGFERACSALAGRASVIRRDLALTPAEDRSHVDEAC